MNSNLLETMDKNNGFSIISNSAEVELFDKVMSVEKETECNYLNLIAECITEISQAEPNEKNCSVEVISESCEVHKYYKQTADATVENHFTRSLSTEQLKMSTDVTEKEVPVINKKTGEVVTSVSDNNNQISYNQKYKQCSMLQCFSISVDVQNVSSLGASKRKAKRKPTVTSLMPNRAHQTTKHARIEPTMVQAMRPVEPMRPIVVQPFTQMHPASGHHPNPATPVVGGCPYYMTSRPQCFKYQSQRCDNNSENINYSKQPIHTAYYKGNTLIEVYSPSVGRGFNPRYNSMLIEPTVQPFLPHITGLNTTMSAAMADLHTFHQMAVEFRVPSS